MTKFVGSSIKFPFKRENKVQGELVEIIHDAMLNAEQESLKNDGIPVVYQVNSDGNYNAIYIDTTKIKLILPDEVNEIIAKLNLAGYEAYVVGGCVRDSLLGKTPNDWDICTSALPDEMINVFGEKKVIPTGITYGTMTFISSSRRYEITTFREEGEYKDSRHPENVSFVRSLKSDLSRRDFTINAMAYSDKSGFIDYKEGILDLLNGKIKCVGIPKERFEEDALRMLRMVRFAATYEFSIEGGTKNSAVECASNLKNISRERITSEITKMFIKAKQPGRLLLENKEVLFGCIPELQICDGFDQHSRWHEHKLLKHMLVSVDNIDMNLPPHELCMARYAALFHDIGKATTYQYGEDGFLHFHGHAGVSEKQTKEILNKRLRLTRKEMDVILLLIREHEGRRPAMKSSARKMVNKLGGENALLLIELQKADCRAHGRVEEFICAAIKNELKEMDTLKELVCTVIENKDTTDLKTLSVNGNDLIEFGLKPGPEIGKVLNQLLSLVMEGQLNNDREELLQFIKDDENIKNKEDK